ncbi:MAG: serine/threonine-protein kinase [Gemmataceae bacterium]
MELTVQNVYGLLLRSRLLPLDEAKAMFARWNAEAKDQANNLVKFASWMVANKYVTEYQAQLLARGHADGFFLNNYKILDRLGKGRMAGVYKAQHKLGQIVAIKVLPPSKAKDPTLLARFQREAKLAIRLRHPNIVRTFQVGQAGELHYLVMEYLVGETLEEVLAKRKSLPPDEASQLIYQALQGLQHIHEQGLVHRDLKPSNLMLVPPPGPTTLPCTLKILDIGLGRVLEEQANEMDEMDSGLTGEGVLLGTPDYMAPEQARDPRSTDIRADIYSLGCVLYHLLAGQPPFPDTNIISQMIRHASEPPRPLNQFNPAIPDGLQQIVNWMMAKTPERRYPTPARAAGALEVYLAAGPMKPSSPDLDPEMAPYLRELDQEEARTAAAAVANVPTTPTVTVPGNKPASGTLPSASTTPPSTPTSAAAAPATPVAAQGHRADKKVERRAKTSERRKSRSKIKLPPLSPPAPADALPTVNVELVALPVPPTEQSDEDNLFRPLNRRDFFMFFSGVGLVVIAYILGFLIARLLFGSRSEPQTEQKPPTDS